MFVTVRRTILARCRQLQAVTLDLSDESDNEEVVPPANVAKLSKVIFLQPVTFLVKCRVHNKIYLIIICIHLHQYKMLISDHWHWITHSFCPYISGSVH